MYLHCQVSPWTNSSSLLFQNYLINCLINMSSTTQDSAHWPRHQVHKASHPASHSAIKFSVRTRPNDCPKTLINLPIDIQFITHVTICRCIPWLSWQPLHWPMLVTLHSASSTAHLAIPKWSSSRIASNPGGSRRIAFPEDLLHFLCRVTPPQHYDLLRNLDITTLELCKQHAYCTDS